MNTTFHILKQTIDKDPKGDYEIPIKIKKIDYSSLKTLLNFEYRGWSIKKSNEESTLLVSKNGKQNNKRFSKN